MKQVRSLKVRPHSVGFGRAMVLGFLAVVFAARVAHAQEHPIPPSHGVPEVHYVKAFGQPMAYYDMGRGPVLVLIHGFTTSTAIDWGQTFKHFAEHYRVIGIDNIGFGLSAKPDIAYTTQTQVEFLAETLRQLKITHFYLDGESMGGGIVALYAIDAAQPGSDMPKVDKLVITDGAVPVPNWPPSPSSSNRGAGNTLPSGLAASTWEQYRDGVKANLFHNPDYETDEYAMDAWELLLSYHSGSTAADLGAGGRSPAGEAVHTMFLEHLKDINVPTLICWGKYDKLIPVDHSDYIHSTIPGSQLVLFETGHAPGMEQPEKYVGIVEDFLGK